MLVDTTINRVDTTINRVDTTINRVDTTINSTGYLKLPVGIPIIIHNWIMIFKVQVMGKMIMKMKEIVN